MTFALAFAKTTAICPQTAEPPRVTRGKQSRDKFKERLRRTALATSPVLIQQALLSIKGRVTAVHAAGGADIPRD